MKNVSSKIRKLTKALEAKREIYLVNREQYYNANRGRVSTIHKLSQLIPVEEYNRMFSDNKKDIEKYQYVKVEVLRSYVEIDILMKLAEIYKEVGVSYG